MWPICSQPRTPDPWSSCNQFHNLGRWRHEHHNHSFGLFHTDFKVERKGTWVESRDLNPWCKKRRCFLKVPYIFASPIRSWGGMVIKFTFVLSTEMSIYKRCLPLNSIDWYLITRHILLVFRQFVFWCSSVEVLQLIIIRTSGSFKAITCSILKTIYLLQYIFNVCIFK